MHDPSLRKNAKGSSHPNKAPKNEWLAGSAHRSAAEEDGGGTAAAAAAVQIGSFSDPMSLQARRCRPCARVLRLSLCGPHLSAPCRACHTSWST